MMQEAVRRRLVQAQARVRYESVEVEERLGKCSAASSFLFFFPFSSLLLSAVDTQLKRWRWLKRR